MDFWRHLKTVQNSTGENLDRSWVKPCQYSPRRKQCCRTSRRWRWTDYGVSGEGIIGVEMPKKYVAEMFCDRLAASKVYRGQDFQPGDPYQFFQYGKKKRLLMHPATSELLETILIVLRDQGEDAAFDYVRREVLGKK